MRAATVRFLWREPRSTEGFASGVCLHGHTMHSQECLNFLPRCLARVPGASRIVRYYQRVRRVDFARAWWTPPLSPASALRLEQQQIAALGLRPMVSLTDHDDIQAGLTLGVTADPAETPVSVEWTVPYERSLFHLGIHNLPRAAARDWMAAMARYTAAPREDALPALLDGLAHAGTLIVLNHPFWLEEGVTESGHRAALQRVLRECLAWFHAFELNGTRVWKENADTLELARFHGRPVISGGDRHAGEPGACLNLTNARSFAGFAAEVREGRSSVVFLPHYREPMAQRVLEAGRDILRSYPEYPGRERWTDRIFYRDDEGAVRTVAQIWQGRGPHWLEAAAAAVQFVAGNRFRPALRLFLAERGALHP